MQGSKEAFRKQFLPATKELFAFAAQEVLFFAILNSQVRVSVRTERTRRRAFYVAENKLGNYMTKLKVFFF